MCARRRRANSVRRVFPDRLEGRHVGGTFPHITGLSLLPAYTGYPLRPRGGSISSRVSRWRHCSGRPTLLRERRLLQGRAGLGAARHHVLTFIKFRGSGRCASCRALFHDRTPGVRDAGRMPLRTMLVTPRRLSEVLAARRFGRPNIRQDNDRADRHRRMNRDSVHKAAHDDPSPTRRVRRRQIQAWNSM